MGGSEEALDIERRRVAVPRASRDAQRHRAEHVLRLLNASYSLEEVAETRRLKKKTVRRILESTGIDVDDRQRKERINMSEPGGRVLFPLRQRLLSPEMKGRKSWQNL